MEYWFYIGWYLFLIFWVKMYGASKPPSQYPGTHYSIVPAFQHSNWGILFDSVG